jgi:hypothetical protein
MSLTFDATGRARVQMTQKYFWLVPPATSKLTGTFLITLNYRLRDAKALPLKDAEHPLLALDYRSSSLCYNYLNNIIQ